MLAVRVEEWIMPAIALASFFLSFTTWKNRQRITDWAQRNTNSAMKDTYGFATVAFAGMTMLVGLFWMIGWLLGARFASP